MPADPDSIQTEFPGDFNALASVPAQSKPDAYAQLLDKVFTQSSPVALESNLTAYVAFVILGDSPVAGVNPSEALSIIASRPLLSAFITRLTDLPPELNDTKIAVSQAAIELLQPRVGSFEEQDTALKLLLADAHQTAEDFTASAKALQSISLDTSQRQVTDAYRASLWVRIARCYLEDEDPTSAGSYINRAKNILHNVHDKATRLQFQLAQARILDSQRAFLEASSAYHAVSFDPLVDEDDRLQTLAAAIVCAVLAPAGPQRARTLARLYKDDRAASADEYAILEKIFLDRVLSPEEVGAFAAKLQPHQLARTADGSTVLDRAVLEHNLLGASRLYRNISITNLGGLLGVGADRAEEYAALMIEQGRLAGHIDQIDGMIFFEGDAAAAAGGGSEKGKTGGAATGSGSTGSGAGGSQGQGGGGGSAAAATATVGGVELRRWDAAVQALLAEVENVTTMIQTEYPDFYAANMA